LRLKFGDFAENLTTENHYFARITYWDKIGSRRKCFIRNNSNGKKCHHDCEIRKKIGDCVMPREGIFTRVLKGGKVNTGDCVEVL